jgi:flagellin-like protein
MLKKIIMNKRKALSPLIATILLVAVALSLAGILYSWSSQNFRDTTTSVSNTSAEWIDCSNVNIYIDSGCTYTSIDGFSSLILFDRSTVQIDQNIVLTIIDNANEIASTEFLPAFTGNAMSLGSVVNDMPGIKGLETPLKRVQVHVKNCPDRVSYISRCN